MVYVLLNFRKHLRAPAGIDPRSSGQHFSEWQAAPVVPDAAPATVQPGTWMARVGWRRAGGPLRVDEHPAAPPPQTAQLESADVDVKACGRPEGDLAATVPRERSSSRGTPVVPQM